MGPHRVDAAILQDDDLIGIHHRGDPLGNDDLGHIGSGQSGARIFPSVAVSTALVESSKIRTLGCLSRVRAMHKRCFLSAGDVDAALSQVGVQPLGIR